MTCYFVGLFAPPTEIEEIACFDRGDKARCYAKVKQVRDWLAAGAHIE